MRTSETDFNNMTRSGYFFGKLVQNTPDGTTDSNWIIEVQAFDNSTGWTFQRATRSSDKAIFTRIQDNGTWSDWEVLARKSDLNTWEDITSDCTLANGISIGTFKVYKNTTQKLIKMNGFLTITSEQEVSKTLLTFPSNIKLIGYQYVLAYNAFTADNYGVYGTDANILRNDTRTIPVMKYFVIPNVTMSFT